MDFKLLYWLQRHYTLFCGCCYLDLGAIRLTLDLMFFFRGFKLHLVAEPCVCVCVFFSIHGIMTMEFPLIPGPALYFIS